WTGVRFKRVSLKSMGLRIQLNHSGLYCTNATACHLSMTVLHTNGLHEVAFDYCGCDRAIPQHLQLFRRQFYPASQINVQTCASFELLNFLHKLALTMKASTYDFYRALEHLTDSSGLSKKKYRYRALFRMILQWRHLKLLLRGGRAHAVDGVAGTKAGELAIRCPSCPYPGVNLPEDWDKAPPEFQFLYTMFACMDANFRLKNQLVSNYSQDPGLGTGWAYMVPRVPYEQYVLSRANDEDISTCVGLQALAQANNRFSKGLRYTGVGGVFCGRSEMVLPNGIGNLQKGERYCNMDYIFGAAIQACVLPIILISYDIACQWFVNLASRMADHWPEQLCRSTPTKFIPAIPKLHEPMHKKKKHQVFSLNFIKGVGDSDFECPEHFWAGHNGLGNATKSQGPGSRHDVLDDHFQFWNWLKYILLGTTLMRRYRKEIAERNIQDTVRKWETMCVAWDLDEYPKTQKNPYDVPSAGMTEAKAKKELAAEEERRLADGGDSLHATSASTFIIMGLDIEDSQNQLTNRIRVWEQLLLLYMPGLLQYQADLRTSTGNSPNVAEHPEDIELCLPSRLPKDQRRRICQEGLPRIEEKLRTAQCFDALDTIRNTLKMKTRLVKFKNKNVRGQRAGTRSRAIIDRVHERARISAQKYRAARAAKVELSGRGDWENDLRVLIDADIRGYQDPEQLRVRQGRRGTLDDNQLATETNNPDMVDQAEETDEFTLFTEERSRRDGTGETRRTLSWIWSTSHGMDSPDNENDDFLRSEWAKSRARAARFTEEVLLLREEMRRTLAFLEWMARWWDGLKSNRSGDGGLNEGLSAYATRQADLQRALAASFQTTWQKPLAEGATPIVLDVHSISADPNVMAENQGASEHGEEDEGEEEEIEDDDEEEEEDEEDHLEYEQGLAEDLNLYV
ncbi:hypothetical protein CPB83DRAFT_777307, partial [Crepidotus variabilis]